MIVKSQEEVRDEFHRMYYNSEVWNGGRTSYFGVTLAKCPLDLWIYQELIYRVKPRVIIETGTWYGGSAYFLAVTAGLARIEDPMVITIDIAPCVRIEHPTIFQLTASSTSPEAFEVCKEEIAKRPGPVMVILDSDHHKEHVLTEMEMYAPLVTLGSYLIVEDTNINGHPAYSEYGPGPYEAVQEFLPLHEEFEVDMECEKFGLTMNPSGYLKRIA